ncbi:MAG TPA: cytochrome c [Roseiflexaceae bacterium]|nr:cytochrome c [Roseiflexaceae bacterium]
MDYPGLGLLVTVALLFAFLAYRAFRGQRRWVKLTGGILSTLLTLLFGTATVLALVGYGKLNAARPNPLPQLSAPISPALVANGERFARSCAGCHSSTGDLPLSGQDFFGAEGGPPIGTLWAPNLTPAHLAEWSDGEIVRAIREGVGRDGRSLLIMPSAYFRNLSDEDVRAIVAYLRSQPVVEPTSPPRRISVLGAIMLATVFPDEFFSAQPPVAQPVVAPPRGPTAAYGGYLVRLECQGCHAENLAGLPPDPTGPSGPNLTTLPQRLTAEEFAALLRTGRFPDGSPIGPDMPVKYLEKMSDDDFRAIYAYLESLGPLPDNQ